MISGHKTVTCISCKRPFITFNVEQIPMCKECGNKIGKAMLTLVELHKQGKCGMVDLCLHIRQEYADGERVVCSDCGSDVTELYKKEINDVYYK